MNTFKQRFQKQYLIKIFLICSFPLHLWTIFLILRDFDWISKRSSIWGAISAGSYAMIYTLLDTLIFFVLINIMSLLIPWNFQKDKTFALTSLIALIIPFWSGIGQIIQHQDFLSPSFISRALFESGHPLRYGIPALLLILFIFFGSIIIPAYLISYKPPFVTITLNFLDKILLLSAFYLFLDLLSIIIILIRNI